MKEWQGRRDDLSIISDEGLFTAQNVSFKIGGEIRRRPALQNRIDESGILSTEWADQFVTPYIVFNNGSGKLRTVKISDGTETDIVTGVNTNNRGCFARSNGRLYFVNDFDPMRRISAGDQTAGIAGINAPTSAIGSPAQSTGVCTAGVHGLRYRYYDSKSLYMSDPSDQLDVTLTGAGTTLQFDIGTGGTQIIRSTDAKVDQVIIEMTDAGSSTFYRAATVNQVLTGTTVNMTDTTLRLQVTAARDGDFNHQPPPLGQFLIEHRGRLFLFGSSVVTITGVTVSSSSTNITVTGATFSSGWAGRLAQVAGNNKLYRIAAMSGNSVAVLSETYSGTSGVISGVQFLSATPDMLYWSRSGFPESWNSINFARRVLQNTPDIPTGLASHHEVIYLFGQRTMRMLDYASDPASAQLVTIPTEMGLWNQRCLIEANGRIYGWCRSGVWTVNGLIPRHLSKAIDKHIDGSETDSTDNYDVSKFEQFHGFYDPRERALIWFYATSSDTYPKHAIMFDVDSQQWSVGIWKQSIRASTQITGGTTNPTRALVSDENGYSWYLQPDQFDGVPSIMSGGVITVSSTGATTTVIPVSESLSTSPSLAGVIAVYSGQEKVISSNTATTITLASALSSAPTMNTELFLGQINFAIRTKWIPFDGFKNKKRPNYLGIYNVPGTSAGKLTVKIYLDYSANPFTYTQGSADTQPDGVTIVNGSSSVTVDLDGGSGDGVAFVPLPAEWNRVIAVEITSTRPQNLLKILDLEWIFKNSRGSVEVEDE